MPTLPVLRALVDDVDDLEGLGVLLLERVNLFTHDDVVFGHVGKEQFELCLVALVGEGMIYDLV